MALVTVLECVSMNLIRCVSMTESGRGDRGYVLHLEGNEPHHSRVGDTAQREDGVVFCEKRLTVKSQHTEIHDHGFPARHEHPTQIDLEVEAAIALTFGV